MVTYPSILAWRIPRTEEPGRLQSMGSQSQTQLKRFSAGETSQRSRARESGNRREGKRSGVKRGFTFFFFFKMVGFCLLMVAT